jgi:hypothetical protein
MVTEANAHEPVRELMESMEAWMLVNGPGNLAGEPAQALARLLPQRLAAANTLTGTLDGRTAPARFAKAAARLLVETHAKHALGVERRDKEARDAVEAAIDLAKEYLGAARMRIEEPYCLLERDPARTHHCGTYRGAFGVYTDAREYAVQESRKAQQHPFEILDCGGQVLAVVRGGIVTGPDGHGPDLDPDKTLDPGRVE